MAKRTSEAAFETAIETALLADGCLSLPSKTFDRGRAIFPDTVLDFIRETQPKEWSKLESLFIERMELNEELFSEYMSNDEMQKLVADWLGKQVYSGLGGER